VPKLATSPTVKPPSTWKGSPCTCSRYCKSGFCYLSPEGQKIYHKGFCYRLLTSLGEKKNPACLPAIKNCPMLGETNNQFYMVLHKRGLMVLSFVRLQLERVHPALAVDIANLAFAIFPVKVRKYIIKVVLCKQFCITLISFDKCEHFCKWTTMWRFLLS
jgi:hypothetical protein